MVAATESTSTAMLIGQLRIPLCVSGVTAAPIMTPSAMNAAPRMPLVTVTLAPKIASTATTVSAPDSHAAGRPVAANRAPPAAAAASVRRTAIRRDAKCGAED
jgi:hypothetical protein